MTTLTRRQALLGLGATALATSLSPSGSVFRNAWGDEIARPDYMIRMGLNENPWGPSRVALQAIADAVKQTNKYAADSRSLAAVVAALNDVPADHVAVGTGSGEILRTAGLLASMDSGSVVCPDSTYQDLVRYAERAGADIIRVPVDPETLNIDLKAMHRAIRKDTRCVYIANPNNPIPSIVAADELRDFIDDVSRERMVFVDEAYFEFVQDPRYQTMMDYVRNGNKNVVVARTASKIHGLAGLRTGFGYAHPDLTARINAAKTSAQNVVAVSAAKASYQDPDFQKFTFEQTNISRKIVEDMLDEVGARYVKSHANFSFIYTGIDIAEVREMFSKENIMVGRAFPPKTDWVRVSFAKPHETEYFAQTYKKLLG